MTMASGHPGTQRRVPPDEDDAAVRLALPFVRHS